MVDSDPEERVLFQYYSIHDGTSRRGVPPLSRAQHTGHSAEEHLTNALKTLTLLLWSPSTRLDLALFLIHVTLQLQPLPCCQGSARAVP